MNVDMLFICMLVYIEQQFHHVLLSYTQSTLSILLTCLSLFICLQTFLYAMTTMAFRANITKLMGQGVPSDTGNMFQQVLSKQQEMLGVKED